jgi:hypothetical protein
MRSQQELRPRPYAPLPSIAFFRWLLALAGLCAVAGCGESGSFAPRQQLGGALADPSAVRGDGATSWSFSTLNDPDEHDFNRLEGINNTQKICGYDGSGAGKKPSRGYCVGDAGRARFLNENYPGGVATKITSLNNTKAIAGWYTSKEGGIFGCILAHGVWSSYKDPKLRAGESNITRLLGINDASLAVGYYTDDRGLDHGFELNVTIGKYHGIAPPGGVSVQATGINGKGDIVGTMTTNTGDTKSWLLKGGVFSSYAYPHAAKPLATGVNWQDQIVGSFVDDKGQTHGFILSNPLAHLDWHQIDEPRADGRTVVTSIENHDYMVGYYVDSAGHTNGFLATPQK